MFASTIDKKTLNDVNALLISGTSLKETSELCDINYQKVHYLRSKLVKAGALQPLNTVTKKKHRSHFKKVQKISAIPPQTQLINYNGIKLVINGTALNIRDAKSVDISTGLIDIKY